MSYDEKAPPVFEGLVHDFKMGEGIVVPGPFPPRRIRLEDHLDDFFFSSSYEYLIGASREGRGQIVDLDIKRKIASVELPGMPHLGSGITRDGKYALVSIWEMDGELVVYDAQTLKVVKRLPMKKPSGKYNVYNKITRSTGTSR